MTGTINPAPAGYLAEVEFVRSLGIECPERIESLAIRAGSGAAAVAIVGLFTRGKSRLFNELLGEVVSEEGANPTTALLVQARTGAPAALATFSDGTTRDLPAQPSEFARLLGSHPNPRPDQVAISGAFRLPTGLVLVDTPGVGAQSNLDERDWWAAGADAGVIVTSLPPGPQGQDLDLITKVSEVYDGRIQVVMKATDSSIGREDLIEAARFAEQHVGRPIMVLPQRPPVGPWGLDENWAGLTSSIESLHTAGSAARSTILAELSSWFTQIAGTLSTTVDPSQLCDEIERWTPHLSPSSRSTLQPIQRDAQHKVRAQREQQQRRIAEQEAEQRELRDQVLANRRSTGEQLSRELSVWNAQPDPQLLERVRDATAAIQQGRTWTTGAADFPELAVLSAAVAREARALWVRLNAGEGEQILAWIDHIYQAPVLDVAAWDRQRTGLVNRARQWLATPPDGDSRLQSLRDRVAAWLAADSSDNGAWVTEAAQRTKQAQRSGAAFRTIITLAYIGSYVLFAVSLLQGCSALLTTTTPDPYASGYYSSEPTYAEDAFGAAALLWMFSFGVWVVTLIIRHNLKRQPEDKWVSRYHPPPAPTTRVKF
jgi:hypothetical protein